MREYIWDAVGRFVDLQGNGDRLAARCPFHAEKAPSFVVDQKRNTYHCFGCDAHGHVEDFKAELDRFRSTRRA